MTTTILQSHIQLLKSLKMDDTPSGGGGPSGTVIPFGGSNHIFRDISGIDRAGGRVQIRVIYLGVGSPTAEPVLGAHLIVAQPPTDHNVSVVLFKCSTFATRAEVARAIENYYVRSVDWNGYLLEDHVAGGRAVNLFHRPNSAPPSPNDTFFLTLDEGKPSERMEAIRITRVTPEVITVTIEEGGKFVDFTAIKYRCELADVLKSAWPGSPPSRFFTRAADKTRVRTATVADAAEFYGTSPLVTAAKIGDRQIRVDSVFLPIVPNTRKEDSTLDQRPAASRTLLLAEAPRRVEVAVAVHTQRIKVTMNNQGYSFVAQLNPPPAKGSVVVAYRANNNWYELRDDGNGFLTSDGAGVGRYDVLTGSLGFDLAALPDVDSFILIQHADNVGYTNRSGAVVQLAPPEYCFTLPDEGLLPSTLTMQWESGVELCTATVNAQGVISGDATGQVDAPSRMVLIRPKKLPNPRGELQCLYQVDNVVTELLTPGAPDAAGFISLTLAQQPAVRSLQLAWATARSVSNTSGGNLTNTNSIKDATASYTLISQPEYYEPGDEGINNSGQKLIYPSWRDLRSS